MIKLSNLVFGAVACFFLVLFIAGTNAFGVASSYNENTSPFMVYPGMESSVELRLQNMIGNEDVKVSATLTDGAGIASMQTEEYDLPFGVKGVPVIVSILIPEGVSPGTSYSVTVHFESVADGETGGVGLGIGTDYRFKVIVAEEPQEQPAVDETTTSGSFAIWWIIGAIVVILVIWWIIKSSKKTPKATSKKRR